MSFPVSSKSLQNSFQLPGTNLIGDVAHLTLSYLGNLQILQIILNKEDVKESVKSLDTISDPKAKGVVLYALTVKVNQILQSDHLTIITTNKTAQSVNLTTLLQLKNSITEIEFSRTFITEDQFSEITKILYLSGARNIAKFHFYGCINLFTDPSQKTLPLYKNAGIILGSKIPLFSKDQFHTIKEFFKGTPYEEIFNKLKLLVCTQKYPDILNIVCDNSPRYFQLGADIIKAAAKTILENDDLSSEAMHLLTLVKQQLDEETSQIHIDVTPKQREVVLKSIKARDGVHSFYEVPPVRENYIRFAINHKKPG